jgi:hypothetical protein
MLMFTAYAMSHGVSFFIARLTLPGAAIAQAALDLL